MTHENITAKVLALDLATTTGWADIAHGIIDSGSRSFARKPATKTRPASTPGEPFCLFDAWLNELIRTAKPDLIVYEEVYRWMSSSAAHAFCGFRAVLLKTCHYKGITVKGYSPTEIKKFFTGKGNAKKRHMIAEARKRWPELNLTSDDEVDAIAILHLHLKNTTNQRATNL